MKKIHVFLFLLISFSAFSQTGEINLMFQPGSDILQPAYMSNESGLNVVHFVISQNKSAIMSGRSHIRLISNIQSGQQNNAYAINRASVVASVVRAFLKVRYGLTNDNFTFYFDDGAGIDNNVKVHFVNTPVQFGENVNIHYTLSNSMQNMELAVDRYVSLPMVYGGSSFYASGRQNAMDNNKQEEKVIAESNRMVREPVVVNKPVEIVEPVKTEVKEEQADTVRIAIGHEASPVRQTEQQIVHRDSSQVILYAKPVKEQLHPKFAVKTNILYWAKLIPFSYRGVLELEPIPEMWEMTPNLELEYYFRNRYSVAFEMAYMTKDYNENYWWKVSAYTIEPRFWFNGSGVHKGFYAGLAGMAGDYDMRNEVDANGLGYTGIFYSGGLSLGYMQPIYKNLAFEIGVKGGYQKTDMDLYFFDGENKEKEYSHSESVSGFRILGVKASLVYRFKIK